MNEKKKEILLADVSTANKMKTRVAFIISLFLLKTSRNF
jgi:hypothetical protein